MSALDGLVPEINAALAELEVLSEAEARAGHEDNLKALLEAFARLKRVRGEVHDIAYGVRFLRARLRP